MKFGSTVLLEIVDIVRKGLAEGKDVAQSLRDIEVEVDQQDQEKLVLTTAYQNNRRDRRP